MNHGLTSFCAVAVTRLREVLLAEETEEETEADARLAPAKCTKATGSALSAIQRSQNFLLNPTRPELDSFCAAIVIVKRDNHLAETEAEEDFADKSQNNKTPVNRGFCFLY